MSKSLSKPILQLPLAEVYQRRLSAYLNDHQDRHNVQAKDVAEKIGISPQKFSYVKSNKKPYSRFINSLDLLARFAGLETMTMTEFLEYIEGKREKDGLSFSSAKSHGWQRALMDAFEPMKTFVRKPFIDLCKSSLGDGNDKLNALVEIVNMLQHKDIATIRSIRDTLKNLIQ